MFEFKNALIAYKRDYGNMYWGYSQQAENDQRIDKPDPGKLSPEINYLWKYTHMLTPN
jgi:hypothetical protein